MPSYPAILATLRRCGARVVRRFTEDVADATATPAIVEGWRVGDELILVLVGAGMAEVYYAAGRVEAEHTGER